MPFLAAGLRLKLAWRKQLGAGKDMRFYTRMAEAAPATAFIAQAVNQTYQLANIQGHGERYMPVLPGILADGANCSPSPKETK